MYHRRQNTKKLIGPEFICCFIDFYIYYYMFTSILLLLTVHFRKKKTYFTHRSHHKCTTLHKVFKVGMKWKLL